MKNKEDIFSAEKRAAYESMCLAIAVYQLLDNKVLTVLVSDGLCEMMGEDREHLTHRFNTSMFQNVHPKDAEMLAQIGYRFAREGGIYDVTYRIKLYGQEEYRFVHTIGKIQTISEGKRVAFFEYADVTDARKNELSNTQEIDTPKVDFLYENMSPIVVIAQKDGRLLYHNQSVTRIIPPRADLDSGITFQQYFFPDFPERIKGLTDVVNCGIQVVEEPYTKRGLEVSVIASSWNRESAYIIYLYEMESGNMDGTVESTFIHRRMAFQNVMFAHKQDGYFHADKRNQNFHIWNLSKNEMVYFESSVEFTFQRRSDLTYDAYLAELSNLCHEQDDKDFLKFYNRGQLLLLFQTTEYPKNRVLNLDTDHGTFFMSLEFIMMQSPDTEDVYLKIWEENITDKEFARMLALKVVKEEYDFVAHMDILADRCWIIKGKTSTIMDRRPCIKMSDGVQSAELLNTLNHIIEKDFGCMEELIQYVVNNLDEENVYVKTRQMSDGKIKNLQIQPVDKRCNMLYIRSTDVTQVLMKEKEREHELEIAKNEAVKANKHLYQAVQNERKKVEAIFMQTVLAVEKALDAKDPYTSQHSERVAKYACAIAEKLNWNKKKVSDLYTISLLHDIGKIGIPDSLLLKNSALTPEEYEQIKRHVLIGSNILKDFTAVEDMYDGILYHHERYDGCGYVFGRKGENIPIEARIIGIADSVDAMYSTRPYREKQSVSYIVNELVEGKGKQFDPGLVEIMLELIEEGLLVEKT